MRAEREREKIHKKPIFDINYIHIHIYIYIYICIMRLLTKQLEIMGLQDWLWNLIKHAIDIIKRYEVVIGGHKA